MSMSGDQVLIRRVFKNNQENQDGCWFEDWVSYIDPETT